MEERLVGKSQADEDEDCMFLMCLLPSIKKQDDIQRLELKIEFPNSATRRTQTSKNLSPPVNSLPIASNSSCPPTPSPRAVNLDSTHSRDSDRTVQRIHRGSALSQAQIYCHVNFRFNSESYCGRRRLFYQILLRSCIL